jgi:hypothetical protein
MYYRGTQVSSHCRATTVQVLHFGFWFNNIKYQYYTTYIYHIGIRLISITPGIEISTGTGNLFRYGYGYCAFVKSALLSMGLRGGQHQTPEYRYPNAIRCQRRYETIKDNSPLATVGNYSVSLSIPDAI